MNHTITAAVLCVLLSGCSSGNPFDDAATAAAEAEEEAVEPTEEEQLTEEEEAVIDEELADSLDSFTYDPDNETLTITGVPTDDGVFNGVYSRRAALDRVGYEAYTAQDGSLDPHVTAYVRDIRGTQGVVVFTGNQFEQTFKGSAYNNTSYSAPVVSASVQDGGLVTYAGTYVGLLNIAGTDEDLLAVADGTPASALSEQATEATGDVVITGDFQDNSVTGVIYNRVLADFNSAVELEPGTDDPLALDDIALDSAAIGDDGSFLGSATIKNSVIGSYGGIFGGQGATEVAGVISVSGHIPESDDEIEAGVFVLSQCGQADADAVCDQPHP